MLRTVGQNRFGKVVPIILILAVTTCLINIQSSRGLNMELFSVDSRPYGVPFGDWTARWWQWVMSIPGNHNPVADNTGQYCGVQQEGPVWFLAGTFGGSLERSCAIPQGKSILFSPINGECNYTENPDKKSEEDLRQCAKELQDQVTEMQVEIDGVTLENLDNYRIQSPLFRVDFPQSNAFGLKAGPTDVVSDGNWIFLQPLPPGNHTIHSKGVAVDFTTNAPAPPFISDITYHLTIK